MVTLDEAKSSTKELISELEKNKKNLTEDGKWLLEREKSRLNNLNRIEIEEKAMESLTGGNSKKPQPRWSPGSDSHEGASEGQSRDLSQLWTFSQSRNYAKGSGGDPTSALASGRGSQLEQGFATQTSGRPIAYHGPKVPNFVAQVPESELASTIATPQSTQPALLTWLGFQQVDQTSNVFLQFNDAVSYSIQESQHALTVHLPKTRVNVKNNQRHLDLRYFSGPIRDVSVKQHRKGVSITIRLKKPSGHQVSLRKAENGQPTLVVSLVDEGRT
jgi:hypothetical protein